VKSPTFNSALLLFENMIRLLVGLFLSVWMARSLGPESYGIFSYVISFMAIFTTISIFGNEDLLVRELSEQTESTRAKTIHTAFLMRSVTSGLGYILCNLAAYFLSHSNPQIQFFIFILSTATLFKALQASEFYFIAKQDLTKLVLVRNALFLLLSGIKFYLLFIHSLVEAFIWMACLETILFSVASYLLFWMSERKVSFTFKERFKEVPIMLKLSWPIMLVSFAVMAMGKIDQLMIAHFHGEAMLGQYAVAVKFVELSGFLPLILISSYFPKILSGTPKERSWRFSYLFGLFFWLGLSAAIVFTLIAKPLIAILYGDQYLSASAYLALYAWLMLLFYFVLAQQRFLMSRDKNQLILSYSMTALILNIALNFILIPIFEVRGAIAASCLAYVLSQLIFHFVSEDIKESHALLFSGIRLVLAERRLLP
jgi:O-antigen/teichoic acid export membrane protein